ADHPLHVRLDGPVDIDEIFVDVGKKGILGVEEPSNVKKDGGASEERLEISGEAARRIETLEPREQLSLSAGPLQEGTGKIISWSGGHSSPSSGTGRLHGEHRGRCR